MSALKQLLEARNLRNIACCYNAMRFAEAFGPLKAVKTITLTPIKLKL